MKVHEVGLLRDSDGKQVGPAVLIVGTPDEIRQVGALLFQRVSIAAVVVANDSPETLTVEKSP